MQSRSASNILGVDVSKHQGEIAWLEVARSDIKFAYVKSSEGVGYIDPMFRRNALGAASAGLKVGFYHYCRPETGNTAKQEATSFVETIFGIHSDLPHVLDVEGAAQNLGRDKLSAWCLEWLVEVHRLTGHMMMIYTGANFAKTMLDSRLAYYPLWVAHYGGVTTPMKNDTWAQWAIFQYSSTSYSGGITGYVDMNLMELSFWNYLFPEPQPEPTPVIDQWKLDSIEFLKRTNLIEEDHNPDSTVTYAELGQILSRIKITGGIHNG